MWNQISVSGYKPLNTLLSWKMIFLLSLHSPSLSLSSFVTPFQLPSSDMLEMATSTACCWWIQMMKRSSSKPGSWQSGWQGEQREAFCEQRKVRAYLCNKRINIGGTYIYTLHVNTSFKISCPPHLLTFLLSPPPFLLTSGELLLSVVLAQVSMG